MGRAEAGSLREVVVETLLVTPSGALSPGLLSASAVAAGATLGVLGGVMVALGHTLFELPYVALLVLWAEKLGGLLRRVEKPMALVTLLVAAYFAYGLLDAAVHGASIGGSGVEGPSTLLGAMAMGVGFTGANPYFLAWWLTIGLPLVRGAARHGGRGFAAMYLSHVWMDYAWLALLAAVGSGLSRFAGVYQGLLALLAILLLAFALDVASRAFTGRKLLPF